MKYLNNLSLALFLLFTCLTVAQTEKPQTPKAPFDYIIEDVTFINTAADSIVLAGTLTLPKAIVNPPVAILINGSGAHDRDCNIMGHKSFWVIADYLTNSGIAVLRYDERGTAQSQGDFSTATTFDLAKDVEAGINFLKSRTDIDASKIGLIGHSEGGLIAPIVASTNTNVAFIVMLAGTGVNGQEVLQSQSKKIAELQGTTKEGIAFNHQLTSIAYDALHSETEMDKQKAAITLALENYKKQLEADQSPFAVYVNNIVIKQLTSQLTNPWLYAFITLDPKAYLEKVTCPVLVLNGTKDVQVLPEINLPAIKKHLETAKNNDVTVHEIEGLNHLFQTAKTGNINEYAKIEETFSPVALKLISDWIHARF
ncbi:alpha/beta fold hydrolase [Olleya sp. UBA1516]|uniref:alpha/beta hydrolase family protein n=1 Tax=Olleya sp. UBA1516 TaxID=1947013 RepID=UPI0025ED4F43|nr:alpha/beta fold hydrolase [Olleya sp. UBA1516]|tara:strand:+ start:707 stop:1813 length:1107 start_codon:yes stop_codon:yes gene_type:complete